MIIDNIISKIIPIMLNTINILLSTQPNLTCYTFAIRHTEDVAIDITKV